MQKIEIDARGFNQMIKALSKKTGASFEQIIAGSASSILRSTAGGTKVPKDKTGEEVTSKIFSAGVKLSDGSRIAITRSKKVWYSARNWTRREWLLLSRSGKLMVPNEAYRTKNGSPTYKFRLSSKLRGEVTSSIRIAKAFKEIKMKYLQESWGIGRKSWLKIMRDLRVKAASTKKLNEVKDVVLPSSAASAANGKREGSSAKFQMVIRSKVSSALNKNAKGFAAFKRSFNAEPRKFRKAVEKDFEKYAKNFAKRNGFTVK